MQQRLNTVYSYHDATKHHFGRYARSAGYLDWATQPHPFRRFAGAPVQILPRPTGRAGPSWDDLFAGSGAVPSRSVTAAALGDLLYHSLALSAWKQVVGPDGNEAARWSLRVNPSSGNLHPTEAYVVKEDGVFHYMPDIHGLEQRGVWGTDRWDAAAQGLPAGSFLLGLTSIFWREAWKYGERAWRYCQHDAGHAMAAVALAARRLGWNSHRIDGPSGADLAALLGTASQDGPEREEGELVLLISPFPPPPETDLDRLPVPRELCGDPNRLSAGHRDWPIIQDVAVAVRDPGRRPMTITAGSEVPARDLPAQTQARPHDAGRLIRARRSAVAMDGRTSMPLPAFHGLLRRLVPDGENPALKVLGATAEVALALFVHRVDDLPAGLYLLCRHPAHLESLKAELRDDFLWERPEGCPDDLQLYRLGGGDLREEARRLSCGQDIAAAGAFSLGMLARFEGALDVGGPRIYPRLFHETGAIGQLLYLEAEAAGLRGTGIGCFFDDEVHRALGLAGHAWQSLYHFTVGGAVDDPRLRTAPAYDDEA